MSTVPVSYTHLDVYKRQAYECGLYHELGKCAVLMYIDNNAHRLLDEEFFCIQSHPRTGAATVSYTHLDVYKRQGVGRGNTGYFVTTSPSQSCFA